MANWKKVDADQLDADMTTVANAIRNRAGTTEALAFPNDFISVVENMQTFSNLLDGITWHKGFISGSGVIGESSADLYTSKIDVSNLTSQYVAFNTGVPAGYESNRVVYYDADDAFITYDTFTDVNNSAGKYKKIIVSKVPASAKYARLSCQIAITSCLIMCGKATEDIFDVSYEQDGMLAIESGAVNSIDGWKCAFIPITDNVVVEISNVRNLSWLNSDRAAIGYQVAPSTGGDYIDTAFAPFCTSAYLGINYEAGKTPIIKKMKTVGMLPSESTYATASVNLMEE